MTPEQCFIIDTLLAACAAMSSTEASQDAHRLSAGTIEATVPTEKRPSMQYIVLMWMMIIAFRLDEPYDWH